MSQRTEAMLALVIGVALVGAGVLTWGQETGKLTIFGDAVPSVGQEPLVLDSDKLATTDEEVIEEDFESSRLLDTRATTADWNLDAGEVRLATGETEGVVQSLTFATVEATTMRVMLTTLEELPNGSAIYYAVSADGGLTWTPVLPSTAATITGARGDWRWQALLKRGSASRSPSIQTITWTLQAVQESTGSTNAVISG